MRLSSSTVISALALALAPSAILAQTTTSSVTEASATSSSSPVEPTTTLAPPPGPVTPPSNRPRARLEPADGKIILGAWLDTEDKPGARDTFSGFNRRIGQMAGSFQLSQRIPLAPNPYIPGDFLNANMTLFDEGSNASLFLTVYPYDGFDAIQDRDIDLLVEQCNNITRGGRNVIIRYGPEMNGDWMEGFGRRPAGYIASFRRVATQIHSRTTAAMLWSPNLDQGGDSFSEYYPGDEYVDWVGLSVYWKGSRNAYPWRETTLAPPNFVAEIIDGLGGEGPTYSFYQNYAVARGKPMAISEGAGTYHRQCAPPGVSTFTACEAQTTVAGVQMSFYNSFLFSETFRSTYPLVKMVQMFEFEKEESDGGYRVLRDFRASIDPDSLAQFRAGLARFPDAFEWATPLTVLSTTTSVRTTTTATTATTVSTVTTAPVTTTSSRSGEVKSVVASVGGVIVAALFTAAAFCM
ncbi:hypothetical protein HDU67_008719 [Dinochytrium kinnereticum]|nr:hypothetical protein HDU67_008719 [Dinochytrium kinnereticum]